MKTIEIEQYGLCFKVPTDDTPIPQETVDSVMLLAINGWMNYFGRDAVMKTLESWKDMRTTKTATNQQ